MRIAAMSDIHGNKVALDAALDAVEATGGVDEYWFLGDLVALGPDPVGVLETISSMRNVRCTRGNTDRYVSEGDRPPPTIEEAAGDSSRLPALVQCAGTFAWTQGAVSQAGWLDWLSELPLEAEVTLPDGTVVKGVHAAPGRDSGLGFKPDMSDEEYRLSLGDCQAGLLLVGHHHRQLDTMVGGTRVLNMGSVSLSLPPDPGAGYVLVDADRDGFTAELCSVPYDREAVAQATETLKHPGASYIAGHLRWELEESVGARPGPSSG